MLGLLLLRRDREEVLIVSVAAVVGDGVRGVGRWRRVSSVERHRRRSEGESGRSGKRSGSSYLAELRRGEGSGEERRKLGLGAKMSCGGRGGACGGVGWGGEASGGAGVITDENF